MNEPTICVECRHYYRKPARLRVGRLACHLCFAPWTKTLNLVTGEAEPPWVDCHNTNRTGECRHFERPQYVALWRRCLTAILDHTLTVPRKSNT